MKRHSYRLTMEWTGNDGQGTKTYQGYRRDHVIRADGKTDLQGSSDPAFRGDASRYNPEELLVAALSSCHMLAYLHLCAVHGICVEEYKDEATGVMEMNSDGSGQFVSATLRPLTVISAGDVGKAEELHHKAHEMCFIARSVNFGVKCEAEVRTRGSVRS